MANPRTDGPAAQRRREGDGAAPGLSPGAARSSLPAAIAGCVGVALICGVDVFYDATFDVSLTYIFPVAWVAWRISRRAGATLGLAAAVADTIADVHVGRYRLATHTVAWNVSLQFLLLLSGVWIVDRLRRVIASERALALRLRDAYDRIEAEVRLIAEIQRGLLPPGLPTTPGLGFGVHYATSTLAGGDYYDFFPLDDGRLGVLIADASGHGPAAAVLMAMTRAIVHREREALPHPARLLEAANRGLAMNVLLHHFATACYLVIDPRTGDVELAIAGHPLPLVRRAAGGRVEEIGLFDGPPLGVLEDARYAQQTARLDPHDVLVLFTDGLTEARHGDVDLLGDEAVARCVAESQGAGAQATVDRLAARVSAHLHGAASDDDVTILAIERMTPPLAAGAPAPATDLPS